MPRTVSFTNGAVGGSTTSLSATGAGKVSDKVRHGREGNNVAHVQVK